MWQNSSVVRFVAVGITNTVVDFSILNILVFLFDINKIAANTISVTIAMLMSYFLNHYIVFRREEKAHAKKFALFIIITVFGLYVIQNAIIYFFVHIFTWPAEIAFSILDFIGISTFSLEFVTLNLAKLLATGITMVWNYVMYKKYVFVEK